MRLSVIASRDDERKQMHNLTEQQRLINAAADSIIWRVEQLAPDDKELQTKLIEAVAAWTDSYSDVIGESASKLLQAMKCDWTNGQGGELIMKRATE